MSATSRRDPFPFELVAQAFQTTREAHPARRLAHAYDPSDLRERPPFEKLQDDHPPLPLRQLLQRLSNPLGDVRSVRRRLGLDGHNLQAVFMSETLIERAEVVALLFNVSDMAVALTKIERLLGGDDGEEEADEV